MIPTIIKLVLPMIFDFINKMEDDATKEAITEVIREKTKQYHELEESIDEDLASLAEEFQEEDNTPVDNTTARIV